jgi:hypothetical protein
MTTHDGRSILDDAAVRRLLGSPPIARLAYTWRDGTPRVVPMWIAWNGQEIVMGAPPNSPKMRVLADRPAVALSVDTDTWPYRVLTVRGSVSLQIVSMASLGESFPEYPAMARHYLGEVGAGQFLAAARQTFGQWTRISLRPEHVRFLDFETVFPSAWSAGAAS